MEFKKLEEIFNSFGTVNVLYKNSPIWIESIQEASGTANVKDLQTGQLYHVPASELYEK
ncbi:H-type small acid-soluble spore protein [Clostridium sp. DJ247]|uniref:H-type small acid-soluble spore protein n=1 Tax=Clostridium sp. DJ247 TaxID=2726188 RepID=UPI0016293530|nr:H-type small acid-soluble spore protein [Clostridium sp. DJ247]MBC2581126.1 H-type small acid-soluble spore protein [Clostridium sp. DJ247]